MEIGYWKYWRCAACMRATSQAACPKLSMQSSMIMRVSRFQKETSATSWNLSNSSIHSSPISQACSTSTTSCSHGLQQRRLVPLHRNHPILGPVRLGIEMLPCNLSSEGKRYRTFVQSSSASTSATRQPNLPPYFLHRKGIELSFCVFPEGTNPRTDTRIVWRFTRSSRLSRRCFSRLKDA